MILNGEVNQLDFSTNFLNVFILGLVNKSIVPNKQMAIVVLHPSANIKMIGVPISVSLILFKRHINNFNFNVFVLDLVTNIAEIFRSFSDLLGNCFSFKRFKNSIDEYHKWVVAYTKSLMWPMVAFTTVVNCVFVPLIIAALCFTAGGVQPEFFLNLIFYIIFTPIIPVTLMKVMFMSENNMIVADAIERIDGILSVAPLPETSSPQTPCDNSVAFKGVTFAYSGADRNALDNITFSVEAGKTVALVGPSGGGKTTAAGLVARFWDTQSGKVEIGGVNVKDIPKHQLNDIIAYVFQDSRLLKTSIFENVRMGRPNATREEVMAALHNAQCDEIIAKFPSGADTVIGTTGVYLSGGEQQRIAIARVMLKDAPIIVLDEATAFADPENEVAVQRAFEKLAQGKTVIMIAHRLTTVQGADCIYVLKDGRIAESGTHAQLMERRGLYNEMYNEYRSSISWKVGGKA